ncbi:MAG TPA: hypothetical protein VF331_13920 [Polyangiales bacterium]
MAHVRGLAGLMLTLASAAPALGQAAAAAGPSAGSAAPASVAKPQWPAQVTLVQLACDAPLYDARELPALLKVELSTLGIDHLVVRSDDAQLGASDPGLAFLRVSCGDAPDSVTLQIADAASGKEVRRQMLVSDVQPAARARALAIAAAELIESSWAELIGPRASPDQRAALPPAVTDKLRVRLRAALGPSPVAAGPSPGVPPSAAPRSPDDRSSLELAGLARAFPGRGTGLVGAYGGYALAPARSLRVSVDAETLLGTQDLTDAQGPIGTMHLYWYTAGLSLSWVSRSTPALAIGPLIRAGYALASGSSTRAGKHAQSDGGFVMVFGLSASLRAPLSRSWSALLAVDAGYLPNGVVFLADLARAAGMAEVTLATRIGLCAAL